MEKIATCREMDLSSDNGLLQKAYDFLHADQARATGLYPYFRPIQSTAGADVIINGQKKIMVGSNNYLGLTTHPKVIESARTALEAYGSGCTGSRFLNGTLDIHIALENELTEYIGKEETLVVSTGFQTNLAAISALVGRHDMIFSDEENHASIYDACRLSYGRMVRYRHNDTLDLERMLKKFATVPGKLIVTDGVFSMSGDLAPLPDIVGLAKKYKATVLIDDAHSVGVFGPHGEGIAHHFGCQDDVDVITGTFSKSFASIGGYVSAKSKVIDYIRHHGRPFMFTASLPPASVAAVRACLEIVQSEPERIKQLWKNIRYVVKRYKKHGIPLQNDQSPIIPILIGSNEETFIFNHALFEAGVFANPVISPAVPPDKGLIRTSYMATHAVEELDTVVKVIYELFKNLKHPLKPLDT